MADARFDATEVRQLEHDLGRVSEGSAEQVRKTMQRAALNIKQDLQAEAEGSGYFSRIPRAISYETWEDRDGITAEIGPEIGNPRGHARAQGSLAFIAYEGTARNGPVFPDPAGALEREADAYEAYLAAAIAGDFR